MILQHAVLGPLKTEKNDAVMVVSDLHLNHDRDFIWKRRAKLLPRTTIADVESYNAYILDSLYTACSTLAKEGKTVYLLSLGDNWFHDEAGVVARQLLALPFEHMYSLAGNHVSGIRAVEMQPELSCRMTLLRDTTCLQVSRTRSVLLSHYPLLDVSPSLLGTLCGHSHGSIPALNEGDNTLGRIFDCGIDNAIRLKKRPYFMLDECISYLAEK